jgi:hypothetical protein
MKGSKLVRRILKKDLNRMIRLYPRTNVSVNIIRPVNRLIYEFSHLHVELCTFPHNCIYHKTDLMPVKRAKRSVHDSERQTVLTHYKPM